MFGKLKELLNIGPAAQLRPLNNIADKIEALEAKYKAFSDDELKAQTSVLKERLVKGESLDDILPDAFAVAREASWRVLGLRPFRVQLIGGIVLHQGRIAEMKTGEGKTLTACLPAYLNALTGKGVHIVTVNDYLAKFQGEDMGKLFRFLGMSVGVICHGLTNEERREAYNADVTYGTNNEMGFDYLRDNMVVYREEMVQRGHSFAIVDEVDSILIDEARTPLIISGQGDKPTDMYEKANRFVVRLKEEEDFTRDEKEKSVVFTEAGTEKAEKHFGIENLSDVENNELNHYLIQALKANVLMKRDIDYVVQDGEVVIVDEFTGRLMVGRRYSDGLHQAIEAKEGVKVERESKTLATITFQNYFRMYSKLSGMTGTAKTEEEEFQGIYKLDVVEVPTNMPMIRKDMNDTLWRSVKGKFNAVVEEIERRHKTGQPILVGTISVEISEMLSRMLDLKGIKHEVLNAKHHAKEAQIVAQAGHFGAVTIATNMAGRGTDILLGGNPDFMARQAMLREDYSEDIIEEATGKSEDVSDEVKQARQRYIELRNEYKKTTDIEHDKVIKLGGLHIIGTERHESRRIDNQLRGRAGRQGDPGSSQFFISLEDDLMRIFGGDKMKAMVERLGMKDDEAVDSKIFTGQIEYAQKRIESRNFEIRKNVLKYDDVMNLQREVIYGQRKQVLEGENIKPNIMSMVKKLIAAAVKRYLQGDSELWDLKGLSEELERLCLPYGSIDKNSAEIKKLSHDEITDLLFKISSEAYDLREKELTEHGIDMRELERNVMLNAVDQRWMDHIDAMDQLRDGIGLRALAQRDPVNEYKLESFDMFDEMVHLIQEDTVRLLYLMKIERPQERKKINMKMSESRTNEVQDTPREPIRRGEKIGRNSPCPCGSGKKYKNCCGKNA